MAKFDWQNEPLIVNLNEQLKGELDVVRMFVCLSVCLLLIFVLILVSKMMLLMMLCWLPHVDVNDIVVGNWYCFWPCCGHLCTVFHSLLSFCLWWFVYNIFSLKTKNVRQSQRCSQTTVFNYLRCSSLHRTTKRRRYGPRTTPLHRLVLFIFLSSSFKSLTTNHFFLCVCDFSHSGQSQTKKYTLEGFRSWCIGRDAPTHEWMRMNFEGTILKYRSTFSARTIGNELRMRVTAVE